MRSRVLGYVRPAAAPAASHIEFTHETPTTDELLQQLDGLERLLRLQNLRREEERAFLEVREFFTLKPRRLPPIDVFGIALVCLLAPSVAYAADLEQTLRNLVTAFTGRILPILALGYLGKNAFSHITGDPNAKNESIRVVIAIACLLGLSGVWNFIASQTR
ncbi:MAG: hypothetical protein IT285_06730 [Bdellovibrionales bacterium]|nr:hypothetical protein [Bdellovibrionales bacterium]